MGLDKRVVFILSLIFLLIIFLFFYNQFKTTGFAVSDQKLLVSLDIPPAQQRIEAGENLLMEIAIRVPEGNIDQTSIIELEYSIRDLDGNLISAKKESGAIAVKESTVASLYIPTDTKKGVYTAFVTVDYEGEKYEGSKTFEVVNNKNMLKISLYILIGILVLIVLIIVIKKIRNKYSY